MTGEVYGADARHRAGVPGQRCSDRLPSGRATKADGCVYRALHIMAVVHLRHESTAERTSEALAAGKSPMEALRCLKRRLSDVVNQPIRGRREEGEPGSAIGSDGSTARADGPTIRDCYC